MTSGASLPHAEDTECAVLGGVLSGASLPAYLEPQDFYLEPHRLIYKVCVHLTKLGVKPDTVSVKDELNKRNELERVGGITKLSSLTDTLPDVVNTEHWAQIIRECRAKREMIEIGRFLQHLDGKPASDVAQRAADRLRSLAGVIGGSAQTGTVWRTLREYQEHPELLQPPEVVVPNLAWRGRVTLLAAREKAGKSTYAAFGAALLSQTSEGGVLWVNLEEAPYDVVSRFGELEADPDHVVVSEHLPNKLNDLEAAIEEHKPDLVVIDTLGAWGSGRVSDWNSAAQVTPVMLELVELARRYKVAIVILHHARKSDGSYRDSSAIAAAVDVLIEMSPDDKDDQVRHFKPKGRWTVQPYSLRWTGTTYESVGGELSIRDRVYRYITDHPGCSKRAIRDNVSGNNPTKDKAIEQLLGDGLIEDRGGSNGAKYYTLIGAIAPSGPCPNPPEKAINGARDGHGMGTPSGAPEKPNEALAGRGKGTGQGTPPVPHPLTGGVGGTGAEGNTGGTGEPLPTDPDELVEETL